MKTIVPAKENIAKLWGHPKPKEDVQYRPMKYLLKTQVEDGTLVHNVVTGQLVFLDKNEEKQLEDTASTNIDSITELITNCYMVPVEFDEYKQVNQLRNILRLIDDYRSDAIASYTILPTTYCNARCFYCYEADFKKSTMTDETADRVINFIHDNCRMNPVHIGWFGGEPTVGEKTIDRICAGLSAKGVSFSSQMVSNGYLFTESLVEKAVNGWKLDRIQITLDGTEEVYNKAKDYKTAKDNPYERVIRNIELLLDAGVTVGILLNMDFYNVDDLRKLIMELASKFCERKNLFISSHPLFDAVGYNPVTHSEDDETQLVLMNYKLGEFIQSQGLNFAIMDKTKLGKLPKLEYQYCMADSKKTILIDPDGYFFKCEHLNGGTGSSYNLLSNMIDEKELQSWRIYDEYPRCGECPLYPSCIRAKKCPELETCSDIKVNHRIGEYSKLAIAMLRNGHS